jgi:hypothetical protein
MYNHVYIFCSLVNVLICNCDDGSVLGKEKSSRRAGRGVERGCLKEKDWGRRHGFFTVDARVGV